jgi:hypothetical protein
MMCRSDMKRHGLWAVISDRKPYLFLWQRTSYAQVISQVVCRYMRIKKLNTIGDYMSLCELVINRTGYTHHKTKNSLTGFDYDFPVSKKQKIRICKNGNYLYSSYVVLPQLIRQRIDERKKRIEFFEKKNPFICPTCGVRHCQYKNFKSIKYAQKKDSSIYGVFCSKCIKKVKELETLIDLTKQIKQEIKDGKSNRNSRAIKNIPMQHDARH